jgi:hypothetical protein
LEANCAARRALGESHVNVSISRNFVGRTKGHRVDSYRAWEEGIAGFLRHALCERAIVTEEATFYLFDDALCHIILRTH